MRLIDADELLTDPYFQDESIPERELFIEAVEDSPTVDAVEVVRCRDCKRWGTGYGGETEHIKVCEFANYMVGANGYCVYGERKMDAEVQDG